MQVQHTIFPQNKHISHLIDKKLIGKTRISENFLAPSAAAWTQYISFLYLGVEEDLRPQETLVADIDGELLLGDGVDARVLLDPLGAVCVVLVKLLHKVRADVAKPLLRKQNSTVQHETQPDSGCEGMLCPCFFSFLRLWSTNCLILHKRQFPLLPAMIVLLP